MPSSSAETRATDHAVQGISVIIPTYERPQALRRCLQALAKLRRGDLELEVIVVNDGGAPLAVDDLIGVLPGLRVIDQVNSGPAGARNTGVAHARYQHLAFTDDDCVPEPDWIMDLAAGLRRHPRALIGGRTANLLRDNLFSETSQILVDAFCCWLNVNPEDGQFLPSNNIACRRDQVVDLGGFSRGFPLAAGEDRDFCDRWRERGWPIVQLLDSARIGHSHWLDHRGYWKQQSNYGRGAATLTTFRRARQQTHRKTGFGFLRLVVGMSIHNARGLRQSVAMTALALESQLAILVGRLQQANQDRRQARGH